MAGPQGHLPGVWELLADGGQHRVHLRSGLCHVQTQGGRTHQGM